jgi:hypothetical protein
MAQSNIWYHNFYNNLTRFRMKDINGTPAESMFEYGPVRSYNNIQVLYVSNLVPKLEADVIKVVKDMFPKAAFSKVKDEDSICIRLQGEIVDSIEKDVPVDIYKYKSLLQYIELACYTEEEHKAMNGTELSDKEVV